MSARILAVTDDTSLQRLLGQALNGAGHRLLLAGTEADAQRSLSAEKPDLLVVDATVAGIDAEAMVSRLRAAEKVPAHLPIVLLGASDPKAKVRGLRAGADDYQSLPIHPAELLARIRRLLARYAPRPHATAAGGSRTHGQVLGFYGAKGGVGTTTLAINTAIGLHREARRRVVLVDGNLQFGDHRVFLDIGNDKRSIVDAVSAPTIDADLLETVVVHHDSGVDLLLAPTSPEAAEHVSGEHHHMARVVETLRLMYDYVVVDLDQRLDDHCLDVVSAADRLLVVLTADLSCIKNVRLVLETMSQIGVGPDRVELLLNRSNAFTGISPKSVEAVLKAPIRYQVVNDYRAAITSLNTGEPFMVNRSDSPIGRSLVELVRTLDKTPAPMRAESGLAQLLPAFSS